MMVNPWQVAFGKVKRNVIKSRQTLNRNVADDGGYGSGFADALKGVADALELAAPKGLRAYRKASEPDAREAVAEALNELAPV